MKLYRAYKEWPLPPKALFINLSSSFQASSLTCCGTKSPFLLEVCPVLGLKCIELSRLWTSQWAWLTPGELLLTSTQGSFFFSEAGHLANHSLLVSHTVALKAFSAWPSALPPLYAPTHHFLLILSDSHLGSGSKAVTANGSWLARWWRIGMISLLSMSPATLPSCVALSLHTHMHKPKLERVLSAWLEEAFVSN